MRMANPSISTAEDLEDECRLHPLKLFDVAKSQGRPLYVSAPMVRYSKLAFRQTAYGFGTDLCWTPMILAKEFNRSAAARDSDFTISSVPLPTIVQLGANSPQEFSRASLLVAPHAQGIDLNCGCPQSWACADSLGAALMNKRELVASMIQTARSLLEEHGLASRTTPTFNNSQQPVSVYHGKSLSVKIRIHKDLRQTLDFIETVQESGIDFITIHGRMRSTPSSQPVDLEAIKILTKHCRVPVIANGDINSLQAADDIVVRTGVQGVMSSRALLSNPGLFCRDGAGKQRFNTCSWEVLESFMRNVVKAPLPYKLVLHHVSEMVRDGEQEGRALMSKSQRMEMMDCRNMIELIDHIDSIHTLKRS